MAFTIFFIRKKGSIKLDNYKEVIEKYRESDLEGLTEEEYKELKAAEMADMQSYVDAITAS